MIVRVTFEQVARRPEPETARRTSIGSVKVGDTSNRDTLSLHIRTLS